jgi:metal-responsive CopG/Arc/MetJ family transcriptional regulator
MMNPKELSLEPEKSSTVTKEKIAITVDKRILEAVDKLLKESTKYRNRSHFFEYGAELLLEQEKKE